MGWGRFTFLIKPGEIHMKAANLPIGFQKEPENWEFLFLVIEGYLKLIDPNYHISAEYKKGKTTRVIFSTA